MGVNKDCGLRVYERRGREGYDSLHADWVRLASQQSQYFLDFDWFFQLVRHDPYPLEEVRFIVVENRHREVVGILPIEERLESIRRIPVRIWANVGSRSGEVMAFASGSDFLCVDTDSASEVLKVAVQYLARSMHPNSLLLIGRLTEESRALRACRNFPGAYYYQRGGVDWVNTSRSWDALLNSLSRKFRASLRNTINRSGQLGKVAYVRTDQGVPEFEAALDDFKRVEASGWKGTTMTGGALATAKLGLQREFVDSFLSCSTECEPFIYRMMIGDQCVASLLALRYGSTVVVLKIGYDEFFRKIGPGHLLIKGLLEYCCRDSEISKVDFVSHSDWVGSWRPDLVSHHWFYIPVRPWVAALPMFLLRTFTRRQKATRPLRR